MVTAGVNGCWSTNVRYTGTVRMWVRFKNEYVKTRSFRYWLGLVSVADPVGHFDTPPYNNINVHYSKSEADNTSNGRMYWAAAHTLNTVNQYRTKAAADGIPLPPDGLNWFNVAGSGGAAAPMLKGNIFSSWQTAVVFLAAFGISPAFTIASASAWPDIWNRYDVNEMAANFTASGFHELGHASHYSLVGEPYWRKYRDHIIYFHGYGSFDEFDANDNPGIVALGEAIGNYTGAKYGKAPSGGENNEWGSDRFIPQGLLWDLEDDTPYDIVTDPNNPSITGYDHIYGFTPSMYFEALTPNVSSIRDFRDRLRTLHLGSTPNTAAEFDTFVDIYDVFN
jgi:hypothetical protein